MNTQFTAIFAGSFERTAHPSEACIAHPGEPLLDGDTPSARPRTPTREGYIATWLLRVTDS
ncbi:hypothetical protein [Mycolicibacterium cosmeticum]|uniref:hypothetical protein n=1 Tax=Mycolicibacterium cosmeticum TaxID=258533 RepID=UPI0032046C5F